MADALEKKIQVTLKRSTIGRPETQAVIARTLGLRKIGDVAIHTETPAIRGMVRKIIHLVQVKEV